MISSNSGGIPEINIHEVTGFLSDVGNVDEMAANAIKLLSDEVLLEKFRKNALKQAKEFKIENILPKYEAYYNKILKKVQSEVPVGS